MAGKELKFSTTEPSITITEVDFDGTYDNSGENILTFTVKGLTNLTQLYIYDISDTTIGETYNNKIQILNNSPINIFTKVDNINNKYKFYKTPDNINYFKGYLDYENAESYLNTKLLLTGPSGHSPILGYAFDGHPIYGPLGYDITDDLYNIEATTRVEQALFIVKLMKSSYTGGLDSEGNPYYIQGSGDLDICNGIFSKTPEFPNGIFHYVCSVELNSSGSISLKTSNTYGYLNEPINIVNPSYPYVIGAYKGIPEKTNFNILDTSVTSSTTASSSTTATSQINQITTYTINFKTLKTVNNKFNGSDIPSIEVSPDENYLNLRPKPHPYIFNFTNNLETDSFFGKDNTINTNKISNLKSLESSEKIKAYGNISKFICGENPIAKGLAVCLKNEGDNLLAQLYDSTVDNLISNDIFLGIALNNASVGESVYVCTRGITSIKIGSVSQITYGDYGMLCYADNKGYIFPNSITSDAPIAGYFLETKETQINDMMLFNVKSNF